MEVFTTVRYYFYLFIGYFLYCLIISTAYSVDDTSIGYSPFSSSLISGGEISHYSSFNPTSATYTFNEAEESAATSGQITIKGARHKQVFISVPTLGSSSITFGFFSRPQNMSTWSLIYEEVVTSSTTDDITFPISDFSPIYRVGTKVVGNSTDSVTVTTVISTNK
jgi:hypothetical protein